MFKTRNFAITMGTLSLFILGGAIAYAVPGVLVGGQTAGVAFVEGASDSFSAYVAEPQTISREDRLATMRKKIAAKKNIVAVATIEESVESEEAEAVPPQVVTEGEKGEMRCVNFQRTSLAWSSTGVNIEEVEGARLVYKDGTPTMVGSTSVPVRVTLAQLPLPSAPSSSGNCIVSDVVGISKNGALMRNTEVVAYASFGTGVLVGYALDGFPIYSGAHSGAVDVCNGATVGGQYRYFVGSNQETIINCYSGTPITL